MKIVAAAISLFVILIACFLALGLSVSLAHAQTASVTLTWTATGDDSLTGTAAKYDLRWAITRPDTTTQAAKEAWWTGAVAVTGMPIPLVAGSSQSVSIPGFPVGTYYFVLRVRDEVAANWSNFSNVCVKSVTDAIRPAAITDLR